MPKYVAMLSFTGEGISNIKQSPDRVKAAQKAVELAGGKWLGYYVTLGRYDGVAILDLPSDETAATVIMSIGSQGNIRTETMRAFTMEEFADIVKGVPSPDG
jgi:uncharacterized protein with GYD domain